MIALSAFVLLVSTACGASFAIDGMWFEAMTCAGFACFGAAGMVGPRRGK